MVRNWQSCRSCQLLASELDGSLDAACVKARHGQVFAANRVVNCHGDLSSERLIGVFERLLQHKPPLLSIKDQAVVRSWVSSKVKASEMKEQLDTLCEHSGGWHATQMVHWHQVGNARPAASKCLLHVRMQC